MKNIKKSNYGLKLNISDREYRYLRRTIKKYFIQLLKYENLIKNILTKQEQKKRFNLEQFIENKEIKCYQLKVTTL